MFDRDDTLIERIKRGDSKALRSIYDLYFLRIVNFSYKLLHNRDDACEVAQDVFMKIWDIRESLDEHKSVSGLIFRMTKFKSIDLLRKNENRIKLQGFDHSEGLYVSDRMVDEGLFAEELHEEYVKVVDKLPAKRKRIFKMSRDENLTHKEIAQKLNISLKTVETQIRLSLQQIKADLDHHRNDFIVILLTTISSF